MDITPLIPKESNVIQSYSEDGFIISGVKYQDNVFVIPTNVLTFSESNINNITHDDVARITQFPELEVLLVGTGKTMQFIPRATRDLFKDFGLYPEAMDTGAACRTYNTLLADGRQVGALLFHMNSSF